VFNLVEMIALMFISLMNLVLKMKYLKVYQARN
jgi:hypothetical protein